LTIGDLTSATVYVTISGVSVCQGSAMHRRAADDRLSLNSVASSGGSGAGSQHSFLTRQRMAHIRRQPGATDMRRQMGTNVSPGQTSSQR